MNYKDSVLLPLHPVLSLVTLAVVADMYSAACVGQAS